ncbi:hypothetical protein Glove_86g168 [Diversispora epigaea]|uniref:Uncharacterized protein n=1 Tax=Diversispora epigaea TaxID=1348612 RepID=A0A397JG72_9GLOM|nr:hypothetical protein Glove_86g168 [Diversispora epigaea]
MRECNQEHKNMMVGGAKRATQHVSKMILINGQDIENQQWERMKWLKKFEIILNYARMQSRTQEHDGWWCKTCNSTRFKNDFDKWTSGNDTIQ